MSPKRVGFLVFDGMMALDLFGPIDAFMTANALGASNGESRYDLTTIGLSRKPVTTESGVRLLPARDIRNAPALDTLIIPGGEGLRRPKVDRQISAWLRRQAAKTRRMVSVCTGVHALASAGLLDGCEVATHWRFAAQIARRFPKTSRQSERDFCEGRFFLHLGRRDCRNRSFTCVDR